MPGEEEEIVDVTLSGLAAAVRLQGFGILKVFGTELIGSDHIVVFEEEAPIGFVAKVLETRTGSPILRRFGVKTVVDLAGIDQVVALAPAEIDAIEPVGLQAKPAIGSVSRWVQVFFTQSLPRPDSAGANRHDVGDREAPVTPAARGVDSGRARLLALCQSGEKSNQTKRP